MTPRPISPPPGEFQAKLARIHALLHARGADGLLLRRVSSFAWATCGAASFVSTAATEGATSLLVTRDRQVLLTNNIEAPRLREEEQLASQDWEFHISPWHSPGAGVEALMAGLSLLCDVPHPGTQLAAVDVARLRASLTTQEEERFRELGRDCAQALSAAAQAIRPGMTEVQVAALVAAEALGRGLQPIVNLVAADERTRSFRHPLPTSRKLRQLVLLALCGRRGGLVASLSRLVHFGSRPSGLAGRLEAAARVNAALVASSRPGSRLSDLLAIAQQAYREAGFPDEWERHHQGGITGYEPREFLALPGSGEALILGHALAWNPTVDGAKVEDTFLVGREANEILTPTPLWPVRVFEVPGYPGGVPCCLGLER